MPAAVSVPGVTIEPRRDDYFIPAHKFGREHGDQAAICYNDYCRLYYASIVYINQVC